MKNFLKRTEGIIPLFKFDLKMKISALLLFTCVFALQANESYSQNTKISVDLEDVTIERLIDDIESKTEYRFLYMLDDIDLNRIVSVKVNKQRINRILNKVFKGTMTAYKIDDRQISLIKKVVPKLILEEISIVPVQIAISGTVTDSDGTPLAGANILEKGTTNGTTSDFDGNFTITPKGENPVLVFTYIGYAAKEVSVNGQSSLTIALEASSSSLDEVVLTASSTFRSQKQAPLSITSLKMKDITKLNANSQGDILRGIPGVTVEAGGGETATNVKVRGLDSGQFGFTPLQYDGVPLISSFGLNSSAHDVYARPDIGFRGVEFVRGGAAILYGAGSVAGLINYTSKTGDLDDHNIINIETANRDRFKLDFYSGGKLGGENSNTFYAITGLLRTDNGPLVTGLPTRGAQFRGNIKKKFNNNKGSFTIHGQYINDKAQFFLPLPLEGESRNRINGNDGEPVEQLLSGELDKTSFLTAGGNYESPIGDGVSTKGGYVLADFKYNFDDSFRINSKARFATYQHNFALYVHGNGANPNPVTLENYVENIFPGNLGYIATYQGGTTAASDSDLVIDNLEVDRIRPVTDYSGELNLIKSIKTSSGSHNITVGTFLARIEASDINFQYRVASEFNNNPKLLNLSVTDADGNDVVYSVGGVTNRIGQTANNFITQTKNAFYVTDEIIANKWRFDLGFRYESTEGNISRGNIVESAVYDDPTLTAELANVRFADGSFNRATVKASDWAASLAALYELNETVNLYANFSRGYFFPQLRGFAPISPGEVNGEFNSENITQIEAGAKFGNSKFSGSVAGYYVGLTDRINITQALSPTGGLIDQTRSEFSTRTIGIEATWNWRLTNAFSFNGNATYQAHEITENIDFDLVNGTSTEANVGNKLGQPDYFLNLGVNYDNKAIDAFFTVENRGSRFVSNENNIKLDPISIGRLGGGYTISLGDDDVEQSLRLGFSVFNLFDSNGLTEGNPRDVGQVEGAFFFGRPILPRRLFLTATFNF